MIAGMIGKAYAFFECRAPKDIVALELTGLRAAVWTPQEFMFDVEELDRFPYDHGDSGLEKMVSLARDAQLRYAMASWFPGNTNWVTAKETSILLNAAYRDPYLFDEGEQFRGEIVYEHDGEYLRHP